MKKLISTNAIHDTSKLMMRNIKTILFEISIIFVYIIIFLRIWPGFLSYYIDRFLIAPVIVWSLCNYFFFGAIIAVLVHGIKKIIFNLNIKYFFFFIFFQALAIASMGYWDLLITFFPLTSKYVTSASEILTGIYFIRSFVKFN